MSVSKIFEVSLFVEDENAQLLFYLDLTPFPSFCSYDIIWNYNDKADDFTLDMLFQ